MYSKHSLPFDFRHSFINSNNIIHIEKKTSLEKAHSFIYMLRFFISYKWLFVGIIFIQFLVNLGIYYFSPKLYKASCTILPNAGTEDLAEFGINYKSITSNRLIAFSKSDIVFGKSIEMIIKNDHLNSEDAINFYNRNLSFNLGSEGEVSIEFIHASQQFSKQLVQHIIYNCYKVNKLIIRQNLAPTLFHTRIKLKELNLKLESLAEPNTKFEINYKLNLMSESVFLKRKLELIETLIDTKRFDSYFSLNKLESYEHNLFQLPKLIFTNILIFLLVFYLSVLVFATSSRIKGFFKLVRKTNP